MLILAFLVLLFANIVNHSKRIKDDVKIFFLLLIYGWFIFIFAFRDNSIPDTSVYLKFYDSGGKEGGMEYLFTLLCQAGNRIGLNFNEFLIIYQIILFGLWFYTSRKLFNDLHLVFMVFMSFMGMYNFGIIIRAGLGLCINYFAIVYLINNKTLKGYLIYYALVTISILVQQAMIVFYILPLFIFRDFKSIVLEILLLIAIMLPVINIQKIIVHILEAYLKFFSTDELLSYTKVHTSVNLSGVYSKTLIKYWAMALIFILLRPRIVDNLRVYNCFLNIYIAGVFLMSATYFIIAGNRLSYMFLFFEFVLVGLLYENSDLSKLSVLAGAFILCIINFMNLISSVPALLTH